MTRDLSRLLRPRSIAVIGGGTWGAQVAGQSERMGFDGPVWRVHPKGGDGIFRRIEDLPAAPDAAFIGINGEATIGAVAALAAAGAGGAVCFASGFAEAEAEEAGGRDRQARLVAAAGEMPILGPNCYGFVNALDGALLWPDQHGCLPTDRGVAILTQSSNIAINLTMQARGLPVAYVVTTGNMAQTSQAAIAEALLEDDRVSAIGLHVEGFGDPRAWEALAAKAWARGVPLVVLKSGRSEEARSAAMSHTAAMAGADSGAQAFLDRLGIARVDTLPVFLETLKFLDMAPPPGSTRIASISCSGGEAGLAADAGQRHGLRFPPLAPAQLEALRDVLGPRVALANPLDYHTYIWRDRAAMTAAWRAVAEGEQDVTFIVADYPRADRCDPSDWEHVTAAAIDVAATARGSVALVATLPELLPEPVAEQLRAGGVVPMGGLDDAFAAVAAAARIGPPVTGPMLMAGAKRDAVLVPEAEAKARLAAAGLDVPRGGVSEDPVNAARALGGPVVVKGLGHAHKTEAGAVALNLRSDEAVAEAAARMGGDAFLVEEMVSGAVAELLVGIVRDPSLGFVLTLGSGGTLTELLDDRVSLLVPAGRDAVDAALRRLKLARLLDGYRGARPASRAAVLDAVMTLQDYLLAKADRVEELEVNPLICTPDRAVAADILLREEPE